jgi:hypothetical protein
MPADVYSQQCDRQGRATKRLEERLIAYSEAPLLHHAPNEHTASSNPSPSAKSPKPRIFSGRTRWQLSPVAVAISRLSFGFPIGSPFPNPVFALDLNNDGKILCLFRRLHLKPFLPWVSAAVLSKFSPEVR